MEEPGGRGGRELHELRAAVNLMREAEASARHATETASRLVQTAEAARRAPGPLSKKTYKISLLAYLLRGRRAARPTSCGGSSAGGSATG